MRAVRSLISGLRPRISNRAPTYTETSGIGGLATRLTNLLGGGNTAQHLRGMETGGGTLFAVVDALTTATSQAHWRLWEKATSGLPEDRTEVTDHPALTVWRRPNPFMTTSELVETCGQHYELTGEWWMLASTSGENIPPSELWPLRPDRMRPVPHQEDYLAGYEYTCGSETVPLGLHEVIFIRRPNPYDIYRGLGPVQAILVDLDSNRYSAEWNRAFFVNSAEPGGIIEIPESLDDDEFKKLRSRWREQHQGVAQAHRVALLERGKWVDRKYTQRDMQFRELRDLSREIVREAFRVSKTMLGMSEDVNRATAQAAEYVFSKWLIVPRLERLRQALNEEFLPLFGKDAARRLEFDFDSPVDNDAETENAERTSKVSAYVALVRDAGVEPSEAAQVVGLPEMRHVPKPAPPSIPEPTEPAPDTGADTVEDPTDRFQRMVAHLIGNHHHRTVTGRDTAGCGLDGARPERWDRPNAVEPPLPTPPDPIPADLPEGAGPDLTPVQLSWESSLSVVLADWVRLEETQRGEIIEQIRDVVRYGDVTGLRGINVLYDDGATTLLNAMETLAADAARQVVDEAAEQGVQLSIGLVTRAALAQYADVAAGTLADGLLMSAVREAVRVWGPASTVDQVADQVREHLESLTDAQPTYVLGGALSQAQHAGRAATILAGPSAALYADEVLDRATCPPCKRVNRKWLGNSDDPARPWATQYPVRGYVACEGRDRCRGQVIAVWRGGKDWRKWIEQPAERGD